MKRASDFEKAQKENAISRWPIHDCAICGYHCGYVFRGENVFYDSGCSCGNFNGFQPRDFESVADHYNMQDSPRVIKEMNEFWGFQE